MARKSRLSLATRYYVRYLLQLPSCFLHADEPDIFLFSTRRGGSTLLRDMIYSQPGFNYIDEPFNFARRQFNPYRSKFNFPQSEQITSIDRHLEQDLVAYIDGLLHRKYVVRSQWRIWSRRYNWRWGRYIVKDLNAKPIIPWIEGHLREKIRIVFQVRHPISVAISVMEQAWPPHYHRFLEDRDFCERYVTQEIAAVSKRIDRQGSAIDKHLLDWYFENLVPMRHCAKDGWVLISFEDIVRSPVETARKLCTELDLPDLTAMVESAGRPSPTTSRQAKRIIQQAGAGSRLARWGSRPNANLINTMESLSEAFGIHTYSHGSPFPKEDSGFCLWNKSRENARIVEE